jgi:hypothetical protein
VFFRNILRDTCILVGVASRIPTKEHREMSSVTSSWRKRRLVARTRRAIDRALARTDSPAMREELLTLADRAMYRHLHR